jgi:hypothetical protein
MNYPSAMKICKRKANADLSATLRDPVSREELEILHEDASFEASPSPGAGS